MLHFLVAISLTAVLAPPAAASTTGAERALVQAERWNDPAGAYEMLRSRPVRERVRLYHTMPNAMRAAVWSRHLLTALAEHPEYTAEQRAVIQDALALLTADFFAIDSTSPHFAERVDAPLRRLKERATEAFGPRTARELFQQMGPTVPASSAPAENPNPPIVTPSWGWRPIANTATCECSIQSDWCSDWSGLGMVYCAQSGGCWFSTKGCGTFLQYACNGMCQKRPG